MDSTSKQSDFNTIREVLLHCNGKQPKPIHQASLPELHLQPLEKGGRCYVMPISSPRMMYGDENQGMSSEYKFFSFTESKGNPQTLFSSRLSVPDFSSSSTRNPISMPVNLRDPSAKKGKANYSKNEIKARAKDSPALYTAVFLGELSVGKSAICRKFFRDGKGNEKLNQGWDQSYDLDDEDSNTPEYSDFENVHHSDSHHVYERPVKVDDEVVRIRILDINSEKHRAECKDDNSDFEPFLEVGDAYALTYSVADRGTFRTVIEILSRMKSKHASTLRSVPVILVGNKCDIVRNRQVTKENGIELASKYGLKFIETSATLNQNVTELFEGIVHQIKLRRSQGDNDTGHFASSSSHSRPVDAPGDINIGDDGKGKSTNKGSSVRRKRRPKKAFIRRMTEFLTGTRQDPEVRKTRSCQDLSVL